MSGKFAFSLFGLVFLLGGNFSFAQTGADFIRSCVPSGEGKDYPVGPGRAYQKISDIPWASLAPGDTVRIFYKSTPYKEKILIRTKGTEDKPIRVCGVAGPNGERPILDGDGASNDPDDSSATSGNTGYDSDLQGSAIILLDKRWGDKVSNIIIDGLHLRNARNDFQYFDTSGAKKPYSEGAACIRIQAGDNITIRNNEIENCGNGIFTMSQSYGEFSLTRNLLVEGNYIHSNGQPGSYLEHGIYGQAIGAVYQFNHFGPNKTGSDGVTLKDRSAGTVVRYNWFDSGSARALDLVEVEDAASWYIESEYLKTLGCSDVGTCPNIDQTRLQKVREAEAAYRKTYVYGNFFKHIGSKTQAGNIIHYGSDNDPGLSRKGTLYFYNNTLSVQNDRDDAWRFRLFYLGNRDSQTPSLEKAEVFNNIVYFRSENPAKKASYLCMDDENRGTINLGVNWFNASFSDPESLANCSYSSGPPTVSGEEKLIRSSQIPINSSLQSQNVSSVVNKAQKTYPQGFDVAYLPKFEYVALDAKKILVKARDSRNDLGAQELSAPAESDDNSTDTDGGGPSVVDRSGSTERRADEPAVGVASSSKTLSQKVRGEIKTFIGHSSKKRRDISKRKTVYLRKKKNKLKGYAPALAGGTVKIYRNGRFWKEKRINADGRWSSKISFKKANKKYKLKLVFFDSDGKKIYSRKIKVKTDFKKPRFTHLPDQVLRRGEIFDWKARDNDKIVRYTYRLAGKKYKTKRSRFRVPKKLSAGIYKVVVIAYDRAGNKSRGVAYLTVK